jgi:phage I-like protein
MAMKSRKMESLSETLTASSSRPVTRRQRQRMVRKRDVEDAKLTEKITRIINKKHREMKEAQEFATGEGRRAIEAERRAEQLQREIDALKGKKSDGPNTDDASGSDPDEPKPGDFKTVGEYTRALVKYEAKKAGETGGNRPTQTKQQEQANEIVSEFSKATGRVQKDHARLRRSDR